MSTDHSFTLINSLKPYKKKWRVQVKLIHSWKQTPPYADETLELVLADQTGVKIHASCPRTQMFWTQRNLPLGQWRVVENFKVSSVGKGKYRPTNRQYKITITNETVFTESDHQDDSLFLTLANYEKISNGSEDPNILIDILGHPYDVSGVQIVRVKDEDRKKIQFRMRDIIGNNLACCLWGSYAEQIENVVQDSDLAKTVWLLRFAKISEFRGEIQITNAFDASLLDLNPTMAEAVSLKRSIQNDSLPLALTDNKHEKREIIKVADDWDDIGISMISEISEMSELDQTKIVCSVKAIDTDWAWFYFGCNRCKHSVEMICKKGNQSDKPLFRCNKCRGNVSNVEPKFKLHLIVEDKTGTCKIMLLNSVAVSVLGSSAVDLWDGSYEEIEDPEILPAPIIDLVGKSFCFGITTSSDGSEIFKVSEVWSGDIIQKIESQSEPLSYIEGGSSCLSSGEMLIKENTQPSSDCSTPLSKRKDNDSHLPDLTSASKKICPNLIKLEKTKTD
ncbi:hypothetical protein N665_0746s0002 [Sinapis alba]|nr:hypothetical protein N665_0746s0002 [Sinapis alba]